MVSTEKKKEKNLVFFKSSNQEVISFSNLTDKVIVFAASSY